MIFVAPDQLQIEEDIQTYLKRYDMTFEFADDLASVIGECDGVYMTRLQDEYDINGESKSIDYYRYALTADMKNKFKPDLAIMHPLPRRKELDRALDTDPRARYWDQVQNGMWMRAAIIAYIFHSDSAILDYYQNHYLY